MNPNIQNPQTASWPLHPPDKRANGLIGIGVAYRLHSIIGLALLASLLSTRGPSHVFHSFSRLHCRVALTNHSTNHLSITRAG